MLISIRTFLGGDEKSVDLQTVTTLEGLQAIARSSFNRGNAPVTLLRRGKRVESLEELSDMTEKDVVVVAFGPLPEFREVQVQDEQLGVSPGKGQGQEHGRSESSFDHPDVRAMLNHATFKRAKERFQADPSKWESIFDELVRSFTGASNFLLQHKEEVKKLMSQTDFGEDGEQEERQDAEEQTAGEHELTAKEIEEINSLMGLGRDREEVTEIYFQANKNIDEAVKRLTEVR